jgi:hypothetical protein
LTNPYQSPPAVEDASQQSGVRSIAGWILIVLGLLLPLRMAWLTWWWWPLTEVERNRFIVLSIFGVTLALIGGWLRFRYARFLEGIVVLWILFGCSFIARYN